MHRVIWSSLDRVLAPAWIGVMIFVAVVGLSVLCGFYAFADNTIRHGFIYLVILASCGIGLRGLRWVRLGTAIEIMALLSLSALTGALASVVLARTNMPLQDAFLLMLDRRLLGLDWI